MARSGTSIFVVSDLHIGGKEGFRMCEEAGQERLAALFRWIGRQSETRNVRIVVAGDIVDFLAEEPYAAFTANEDDAALKLRRILNASADVWSALSEAAGKGSAITLMLGNHDVELSMPKPRRVLLDRIGGAVEFLCDNEAFSFGALLVEHGNRYDGWNAVDHDGLRQLRSRSSRGEAQPGFATQPGSELVARVMNRFKQKYPWVDLLKPETAGVIPILAALGGPTWQIAADSAKAAAGAAWRQVQVGMSGTPRASQFVSAGAQAWAGAPAEANQPLPVDDLEDVFKLFDEVSRKSDRTSRNDRMVAEGAVTIDEELLFRGLRHWGDKDNRTFDIEVEKDVYLTAANAIVKRGRHKVIVFGHTHHVKKIALPGGATYLNTGTWADLMRIPEVILKGEESAAREAFGTFMTQLKTDAGSLRRLLPTFARIDFDDADNLVRTHVSFFDENEESVPVTTGEVLRRLA